MKPSCIFKGTGSLLAFILLFAGCSLPQSTPKPVYYYTLAAPPLDLRMERTIPAVIRVERFTANPVYDTQRIIYGDKGLHRNAYANFKWISPPGDLIAYALLRDLQQCGGFQAVLPPPAAAPPTHAIYGFVEEFMEEDYSHPAQAALRLNITLIDARQPDPIQRILLQKSYSAKAPCDDRTPAALAEAMSVAAAQINAEVVRDIYRRLATGE